MEKEEAEGKAIAERAAKEDICKGRGRRLF
jgi:hypothetical protein